MDDEAVDDDDDFAPSPPGTPPTVPTFLLPPERVIITQPTPETEFSLHQGTLHAPANALHCSTDDDVLPISKLLEYLASSYTLKNIRITIGIVKLHKRKLIHS